MRYFVIILLILELGWIGKKFAKILHSRSPVALINVESFKFLKYLPAFNETEIQLPLLNVAESRDFSTPKQMKNFFEHLIWILKTNKLKNYAEIVSELKKIEPMIFLSIPPYKM